MNIIKLINGTSHRFYNIRIVEDLLGDWNLIREYGGMHNHKYHSLKTIHQSFHHAQIEASKLVKLRAKRGYALHT